MKVNDFKVEYIDHMGSDLSVVNAARVSFSKYSNFIWTCPYCKGDLSLCWLYDDVCSGQNTSNCQGKYVLSEKDKNLIEFLARGMTRKDFNDFVNEIIKDFGDPLLGNNIKKSILIDKLNRWRDNPEHWAPFAHAHTTFRITVPIFVARQLAKHQIGFTLSEVSRRYVSATPNYFTPKNWRKKADNVKQGSLKETIEPPKTELYSTIALFELDYNDICELAIRWYEKAIYKGVCPEQARMILPQSVMTEFVWTGSLYGWARLCVQRLGEHAQDETKIVAKLISKKMQELYPVSWDVLVVKSL